MTIVAPCTTVAAAMRAGDVFTNPVTGERMRVHRASEDGKDVFLAELTLAPGAAPAGEHRHRHHSESLVVLAGRIGVWSGGDASELGPGGRIVVEPGTWHDWWNAGEEEEAKVLVEVRPGARFEQLVATVFGLARAGRTDDQGRPGLLQGAILGLEYRDVMEQRSPPPAVQILLHMPFAAIGRACGLRHVYPEHAEPDERATAAG